MLIKICTTKLLKLEKFISLEHTESLWRKSGVLFVFINIASGHTAHFGGRFMGDFVSPWR